MFLPFARSIAAALLLSFAATPAFAYIGPGAGLGAFGTVLAIIGAFLLLIVGFVWYPVKRLLRSRRAKKAGGDTGNASETNDAPEGEH